MSSLKNWRKWHRNILGYFKWVTLVSAIIIFIISVTGILLEHKNDFRFLQTWSIPAKWLPDEYTNRLNSIRQAQLGNMNDQLNIPINWVIYDLHSGIFFGKWAVYYYDVIAGALIALSITGTWMFLGVTKKRKIK